MAEGLFVDAPTQMPQCKEEAFGAEPQASIPMRGRMWAAAALELPT